MKWERRIVTNADRIRLMGDEELLEFLSDMNGACTRVLQVNCGVYADCRTCWRAWLKKEADESKKNKEMEDDER